MARNFRILRICTWNRQQIEDYFFANNLSQLAYQEQVEKLRAANYIMPGSWASSMEELGHECTDLLLNAVAMQRAWCRQRGIDIDFSQDGWMYRLLQAHIEEFRPDVIFFYAGVFTWFSELERRQLREDFPFLKFITGYWGDELTGYPNYSKAFSGVDFLFTNTESTRDELEKAGMRAELLGNCFDPTVVQGQRRQDPSLGKDRHLVFLGNTGFGCDQHRQRYLNDLEMMQKTDMEVWTTEANPKKVKPTRLPNRLIKAPFRIVGKGVLSMFSTSQLQALKNKPQMTWKVAKYIDEITMKREGIPVRNQFYTNKEKIGDLFPERTHPTLPSWTDYFEVMRRSRFVFNAHRDELSDYSNIRVFEATGVGSCLVTDRGSEMKNFFEPDTEIVTYASVDEAVEKINYLDENESIRKEIAEAGQKRTLRDHTVQKRCEMISETLSRLI